MGKQSGQVMELWVDRQAGGRSGFFNLSIVTDLPWVTLVKSLPSVGLSL